MKFEIGQKVKCIDAIFAYGDQLFPNRPIARQIYTVRTVSGMEHNDGCDWYVTLEEISNPPINDFEPAFNATRFELAETPTKTLGERWEIADLDDLAPPQAKAMQFIALAKQNNLL